MLFSSILRPQARPLALCALAALCVPLAGQAQTPATSSARATPATTAPVADAEVQLYVGETRLFPAPGVKRIAVGNGQLITANVLDGRDVLVFANAPGVTNMMFWDAAGRMTGMKVTVTANDARGSAKEIASFLSTIPNARTSLIGDKVIVEGDNLADRDLAKIDELSKRYPQVVNFTSKLGWEKMIMMDVKVVEFPTNLLRDIGLKWNATGGAAIGGIWSPATFGGRRDLDITIPGSPSLQGLGGSNVSFTDKLNILSAMNLGLAGTLNLLVRDGQGSILAEPQLSARNGSKATFLAGGEYPYTVSSINGQTVFFKPFGIKLDIVPQVDKNNMVRAVIDSEVSSLDTSLSTNAGPALSTRRTSTEFNVKAGETMVLAGLLSRKTTSTIDKVPFLGDIPVLGALFRSKRFQNDETELVVFVTPTIVDAHTSSLTARVDDATQRLERDAGKSPYLPAIETLPPANAVQAKPVSLPQPALVAPTPVVASSPASPAAVAAPNPAPALANPPAAMPARVTAPTPAAAPSTATAATAAMQATANERAVAQAAEALAAQRAAAAKPTAADIAAEAARRAPRNETTPLTGMPVSGDGSLAAGMYRVNQYDLPLRSSAEFDGRVLRYLPLNAVVEVLPSGRKGYFVAVKVGEQTGWVGAQWLRAQ
ncbi:pilus assembly protein N-terminal domain-containing protein [Ideonella sp.]|uniref:pilus assembly protein N-terminal domain-containing protein n=1 Tax=Ideonella sp. TaxID=1929293 RepID=UPI0037C031D0